MNILKRIQWSLRRLIVPVQNTALVLEVGSGGNPYPRSNVLVDAYEESRERFWVPLVQDRPTILSFGENLPFKDKVFDFVIAAHVLEHTPHPERFLAELQRVAKAGYIETPDAFMERINPYRDHRLEVTVRNNKLIILKKSAWICDNDLVQLYEERVKKVITGETIPNHAEIFHTRYYWKDEINFTVLNPEVDATWDPPPSNSNYSPSCNDIKSKLRLMILRFFRYLFSQNIRNKTLDIISLMRCPRCHVASFSKYSDSKILCEKCRVKFNVNHNKFYLQ